VRDSASARAQVTVDGEQLRGVDFVEAMSLLTLNQLPLRSATSGSELPFISQSASLPPLPLVHFPNYARAGEEPFLSVQVTRFACAGVCIGLTYSHLIADCQGWSLLINNWAAIARTQAAGRAICLPISAQEVVGWIEPDFERTPFEATDNEVSNAAIIAAADSDQFLSRPATREWKFINATAGSENSESDPLGLAILRLSAAELRAIKAAASPAAPSYVTTFESLAAHLYLCAQRARQLPPNSPPVRLSMVINGRQRHQPPLPAGYFGNFAHHANAAALSPALLLSLSLKDAAAMAHSELAHADHNRLRFLMRWLRAQPSLHKLHLAVDWMRDFTVNSWSRFNLYSADFGAGTPVFVMPAWTRPVQGMTVILEAPPSSDTAGGVDVHVFMKQRELDVLMRDPQLRQFKPQSSMSETNSAGFLTPAAAADEAVGGAPVQNDVQQYRQDLLLSVSPT
jgi:hypothetical protein